MKEKPAAINCRRLQRIHSTIRPLRALGTFSSKSSYTARLIALSSSAFTTSSTDTRIVLISTIMFSKAIRENIVDLRKKTIHLFYHIPSFLSTGFLPNQRILCKCTLFFAFSMLFLYISESSLSSYPRFAKKSFVFFDFFTKKV
jgi:hypothetical protein